MPTKNSSKRGDHRGWARKRNYALVVKQDIWLPHPPRGYPDDRYVAILRRVPDEASVQPNLVVMKIEGIIIH